MSKDPKPASGIWFQDRMPEKLDTILAATPLEVAVSRECLAERLVEAWTLWCSYTALDSFNARRLKADAREAHKAASKLKQFVHRFDGSFLNKENVPLTHHVIDQLIARFAVLKTIPDGPAPQLPRAPKEWLVSDILRPIFEQAFNARATAPWSPTRNCYESSFVQFAVAVGELMGISISQSNVGHALKKSQRKRDKKRPLLWISEGPQG